MISCNNCFPVTATPPEDITYELTVIDQNGCSSTEEINIFVQKIRSVYIPNAFSPNGDGINDRFTIFGGPNVEKVNTFKIFSRWGEALFEGTDFLANDLTKGWDGIFRGEKMDAGVYIFFTEVQFLDGQTEIFKGDLILIR